MSRQWAMLGCAAVLGAVCAPHADAQNYKFKNFVYAKGYSVYPDDINVSGQVAGVYLSKQNTTAGQCFIKTGSVKQKIADPAGKQTQCYSINKSGSVVGNYVNNKTGNITGFAYINKVFTNIEPPGAAGFAIASGISDSGLICGYYQDSSGTQHGFLYDGTTYTTYDVPGAISTACIAINDKGQFTVQAVDTSNHLHGYLNSSGNLVEIAFAGASYTAVYRVNNLGQVAAEWVTPSGVGHGGVYDSKKAAYYTIDDPGKSATGLLGIDDKDTLTGIYSESGVSTAFGFVAHGTLPK